MKNRLLVVLAIITVVLMYGGLNWAAGPALDQLFIRYPGAERVESEHFDSSYLDHGWLSRNAAFQTAANIDAVTLWYTDLLPDAEVHEAGVCVSLHQSKALLRLLRTVTVQLCRLPPGTRILVNEAVLLAP